MSLRRHVHFAARQDADETVHNGPAYCRAGGVQYVTGDWASVTCRNCHRKIDAYGRREDAVEAADGIVTDGECVNVITIGEGRAPLQALIYRGSTCYAYGLTDGRQSPRPMRTQAGAERAARRRAEP